MRKCIMGLSIKYVTLEGVREGVTICDRATEGGGSRACEVTLFKLFHTYKTVNLKLNVMFSFLL